LGGEAMVPVDPSASERVERPVLQEDIHRSPERGGACGQNRGGLELVVRSGEQHEVERLTHRDPYRDEACPSQSKRSTDWFAISCTTRPSGQGAVWNRASGT